MDRRRSGFSLIELLVVIGIILVLVGMAMVGYNQLDRTAAGRSTRTMLHNLTAMQAELDAEAGPDFVEGPVPPGIYAIGSALPNPGDVNPGGTNRYQSPVIGSTNSTQGVIAQLMRSPKNKDAILQIPSKQLMGFNESVSPPTVLSPPVILDAWNNPIIFVPSGGLTGVKLMQGPTPGATTYTIRSSGVYATGTEPQPPGSKDRPFWASAGQDGNFLLGDDNIYSFQN